MECGIVGLPGSGKTSLFAALTGSKAVHEGGASRANVGVAEIPDPRLVIVAECARPRKVTPATITFVDIPGIDPGRDTARMSAAFEHVRQVDALCEVVRCFGPRCDPRADITTLADELILADLGVAESALDRAKRPARTGDADARARAAVLERVVAVLNEGRPVRAIDDWTPADRAILKGYGLVSAKRILYVANVTEEDLAGESEAARQVREHAAATGDEALALCATLESELAELEEDDRREMLDGLGLAEPAIGPLARAVCRLLGLAVFYTAGDREVRAWTVAHGATAPEAAGVIHTDMQRGFIRAECYSVDDLREHHSEKAIRAAGKLRTEGKGYQVRDGDVVHILFNV